MENSASFLLTLAGVGTGIVTMCALVGMLRQQNQTPWTPREANGLKFIVENLFCLISLAFLPLVLEFYGLSTQRVNIVSDIAIIFFSLLLVSFNAGRILAKKEGRPKFPAAIICGYFFPTLLIVSGIIYSITKEPSFFWVSLGLLNFLVQPLVQLYLFLLSYSRPEKQKAFAKTAR